MYNLLMKPFVSSLINEACGLLIAALEFFNLTDITHVVYTCSQDYF